MRLHALILEGDAWGNIVNVSRHDSDFKMATHHVGTQTPVSNMTATIHCGWPKRLMPRSQIRPRNDREGELPLIADCLRRRAAPQKMAKAARAGAFLGERGNRYDTREYCTQEFRRNRQ